MFKFRSNAIILCSILFLPLTGMGQKMLPYKNPKLSVEVRAKDLLNRMTLDEKVGQLRCTLAWNYYTIQGKDVVPSELFKKEVIDGNVGMLWATFRADPWTRKSLTNGLTPELAAKASNALQRYVLKHTRLGIPLFLAEEAPHGHMAIGTTVFPTGLGMAATFAPNLVEKAGEVIAKEIRLQGGHISYGPVLDLTRDPRWSRVEEAMGEDPVLAGEIGAAEVRGLMANKASGLYTLPTLKHFIGYGTTEGGQNGGSTFLGQREIHENFLPPFHKAIKAGAVSVMTSYNSLDGIPSTMNSYFLKKVLRHDWKFKGFVVSDLYSIDGIFQTHHVTSTLQLAGVKALEAGVDVDLGGEAYKALSDAVRKGMVSEAVVDSAVIEVLRQKIGMGLFEHPFVDPSKTREVRSAENKDVAYRMAQASITLLENKGHCLPLKKNIKVAVVGPNANNVYNQLGDYTAPQADGNVKTVLDGIQGKIGVNNVVYAKGCAIRDTTMSNIQAAVDAAKQCEVVVAVVGGSSARDFKTVYKETGAAIADSKTVSDMESGEGFDRSSLHLLGDQMKLLKALKATGKPLVVVYIEGRPLDRLWASENANALLTAYYPGQEGGRAVADVLFGDYNPAGRCPVSVPRSVGQLPVYYNKKQPAAHDYVESTAKPLYAFGFGRSYTTFSYSNLTIEKTGKNTFKVSFDITNTGTCDGEEVAQLYLHDQVASVVQPLLQLKHFARVMIEAGKTKHINFNITQDDLSIIGEGYQPVVEPGDFDVLIGASSDNILLKGTLSVQ